MTDTVLHSYLVCSLLFMLYLLN